jgi:hypothetical protein
LTPLADGEACFALTLIKKEPREIIFSSLLLLVLAILAPLASAQQRGYIPANLVFDPIYSGGPYPCTYYIQNTGSCDLVEFSHGNSGGGTPDSNCNRAGSTACPANGAVACAKDGNPNCGQGARAMLGNESGEDVRHQPSDERLRSSKPADFNRDIYYRNKLEFSLDGGWLPINIPLPIDIFEGWAYNTYPLKYTLVPIIASLRWQMNGLGGPWILRGNWDLTFSGSLTAIPRGPETRYFIYMMGIRRNFVPRNWRIAPYVDMRFGLGNIDAKGPEGVAWAQGEDFTFTFNMGSGVRYSFNPRYAISAGLNYQHVSNASLSEPKVPNFGINVYGPMFGIDIQLRRHQRHSE